MRELLSNVSLFGRQSSNFGPPERVVLAEALYRIRGDVDLAKALVIDLSQPDLVTEPLGTRETMAPFLQRFRLNRLLYAFGAAHTAVEAVPDAAERRHDPIVFFERGLTIIAKIWGAAWRGRSMERFTLVREAQPLLRLFNHDRRDDSNWIDWHPVLGLREEFYKLLVQATAEHGGETLDGLAEEFDTEWVQAETKVYWPVALRRSIILAFLRAGKAQAWAAQSIRALECSMLEEQDISGRVGECRKQAEAWLALGDVQSARGEVERALRLSFGVGYRKDYQLDDWIGWLTRVNTVTPDRAGERIAWFARMIPALDEITEGRAASSAAIGLLKTCFRWSPRRTIALFDFFIDHRVVGYEAALTALLVEGVKERLLPLEIALFCASDFLVPISREGDEELAAELVRAAVPDDRGQVAGYLVERVSTWGLASTRARWRRGVARELRALGQDLRDGRVSEDDLKPERDEGGGTPELIDGPEIDEAKLARIQEPAELEALLARDSHDSLIKWDEAIARLEPRIDLGSVERLTVLVAARRRPALALAVLSEIALHLGDRTKARTLAMQAFDASEKYGWDRWMDGGTRLAAFRALSGVDKVLSRRLAFNTLAQDWGGGARNLDEILPLLVDDLPIEAIWRELESYVSLLFEGLELEQAPPGFSTAPGDDSAARAIADLIAVHISHPCLLVAQAAQRTAAKLLQNGSEVMRLAIETVLRDWPGSNEEILLLLDAVARQTRQSLEGLRDAVLTLLNSPSYSVRRRARAIATATNWDIGSRSPHPPPARAIYDLTLPPLRPDVLAGTQISPTGPLPDSEDPATLVSPFTSEFDAIARAASIPKENIYQRARQIMYELAPIKTWSADGEAHLRATLSSAGLKFPFRRPRAQLARRALFHIIAELIDAERLTEGAVSRLLPLLTFDDPNLVLQQPAKRPVEIASVVRRDGFRDRNEEWIERLDEVPPLLKFALSDGRQIIAEHTTLKLLEWAVPTERRFVALSAREMRPAKDFFENRCCSPRDIPGARPLRFACDPKQCIHVRHFRCKLDRAESLGRSCSRMAIKHRTAPRVG